MSNPAIPLDDFASLRPPMAARVPRIRSLHGETLVDDYDWFRDKSNPDLVAYLEAENAYADAVMRPAEELRETLYREMLGRIRETDVNVPWRLGEWLYYSRTEEGKQYSIICRKALEKEAPEQIVLDLNALAAGHEFLSLGDFDVSSDGNLLAYSTDTTGFRQYRLFIKDLRSGDLLADRVERVSSISWASDNRTIFLVTEDHAKRPYRLYRHRVGGEGEDDLVFEEKDELYRMWITRSRSRRYFFLTSASATTSEVRYLETDRPGEDFRLIDPRQEGREYYVDHRGSELWVLTDDAGKNFRLARVPLADPRSANWTEVLPHREGVKIEEIEIFENHLVVIEREDGLDQFRVIDLRNGEQHRIGFAEPVYSAAAGNNRMFETTGFRLAYESFVTPLTVYDYDMETRELRMLKQTDVLGGYDPARYVSERRFAEAEDGARIPISIVRRSEVDPEGRNPLLLYGYGAYGYPLPVVFSSSRLSLLDRGIVFAMAHVRGGGELGKEWHDRGKMEFKRNSFSDFIASAEHLVSANYTTPSKLVILGGSAGGLLVGAAVNLRPDLFRAAIAHVPFVDVVNTMLDPSLPLTVGEYLEWGNPQVEEEYRNLRSYDPYYNLARRDYPALLVRTSFNDSQVMYWEAAKYVARMRMLKTDTRPLLLKTSMDAGHSGASGRYDRLREEAWDLAFVLDQLGIHE